MKHLLILSLALTACEPWAPLCDGYASNGFGVSGYDVQAVERDGLLVDAPASFDTANLAAAVDAIDACIADIGELPFEEAEAAWCPFQRYVYQPIRRECIEFKVTKSWHWSHDLEYQLLYDEAPWSGCAAKGFTERDAGCYWRATVQNGYQVVMPEEPRMSGDPLLQIMTGCAAPYNSPRLARCAEITVGWDWDSSS